MTDKHWEDATIPFDLGGGSEPSWSPDCQGKWDYDGRVVHVSTRYWPGNYQNNGKPSAKSSFMLCGVDLVTREFEGETEAEVKASVEIWVREQFERLKIALVGFGAPVP